MSHRSESGSPRRRPGAMAFERRLAGYALAGGAALGGAGSARADVVYSGIQDIQLGEGGTSPYNLDLTGNGTTDYSFTYTTQQSLYPSPIGPYPYTSGQQLSIDTIPGSVTNSVVSSDGMNADYLTAGTLIGPSSPFASGAGLNIQRDYKNPSPSQPNVGNFDGKDGYVGFQFYIGDSATPNYGWAQLDLTNFPLAGDPQSAILVDWAYETTPGLSILTAVPEPASLGLLALGAVGVGAYVRSRRKAVAAG